VRAGRLPWPNLLKRAVSGANTPARGLFARLVPSDRDPRLVSILRLPLCLARILKMQPLCGRTCSVCGERLPQAEHHKEYQTCRACLESSPCFTKATAYAPYQSELRDLIHLLKYEGGASRSKDPGEVRLTRPKPLRISVIDSELRIQVGQKDGRFYQWTTSAFCGKNAPTMFRLCAR
jgi:hypothetical protein